LEDSAGRGFSESGYGGLDDHHNRIMGVAEERVKAGVSKGRGEGGERGEREKGGGRRNKGREERWGEEWYEFGSRNCLLRYIDQGSIATTIDIPRPMRYANR